MLSKFFGVIAGVVVVARPYCHSYKSCGDCAGEVGQVGLSCHYCPEDDHCHAWGSLQNPCSSHQDVVNPDQCSAVPTPAPVPPTPPRTNGELDKILQKLFTMLKITDVDVAKCAQDETGAYQSFKDFGTDMKAAQYSTAMKDLSRAISSVSNSVSSCNVPEVQQKLDVLAASIRWANISTSGFDHAVEILVDASNLWEDLEALSTAVSGGDFSDMGEKLAALLDDWSAVTGGCGADNKACKLIDGLLRALSVIGEQVDGCEGALEPALADFEAGVTAFKAKNYSAAVQKFATGLDVIAVATKQDSCGLKAIGDAIAKVSPALAQAVAKVESSGVVKILVGSADVYDDLYALVMDFEKSDWAGVGMELGALLAKLRSSGCETQLCIVLEGLLGSMQIAFTDLESCSSDFKDTWSNMQEFLNALEAKKWDEATTHLGAVFADFSSSVQDCGVQELASVLEDTATRLQQDSIATIIGDVAQVLVSGADVSDDLSKIIADAQQENWAALGQDLGALSDWVSGTGCNSFVCRIIEGILQQAKIALVDLKPCEQALGTAEQEFAQGAALWKTGDDTKALQMWAAGLNDVAKSVSACGVATELAYIEHEAQVLGLGNLTILDGVAQVIVHGADFYEDLYAAVIAIENKDYRSAGEYFGKVMDQLSKWTTGHLCTSPVCYVVSGVLQYLADMEGDFGACKSDFKGAWGNFIDAFQLLTDGDASNGDGNLQFSHNSSAVKQGIQEIGNGIREIAAGVSDCHLAELADILEQLAEKLGIAPEIQWVETLLKILIEGHDIEVEIADVCTDYAANNWPALGYDLVKLTKSLLALKNTPELLV